MKIDDLVLIDLIGNRIDRVIECTDAIFTIRRNT